ncbi:PGF-CTERM-anchored ABC transporter substrate-binding protein [Halalkalirubrum salinum]|uniref:PGF-CTERM-anchored ABC transporter substrate-binding protein n=1 Tax=Halalkalirubrum salinum TaxID=2563889 RepID=UPI0010FB154F|nr:PGF-CTERM-anchored ABC transporter substrate-binding protein [Halalkalirubrum salinum]
MRDRQLIGSIALAALLVISMLAAAPAAAIGPASVSDRSDANPQVDASCEFPIEVTDATGETVTIEERPERVTTTNPSAAQIMWEIGGREQVVGTSQFAHYLEGMPNDDVANVSSTDIGVSVERVVATEPDLVLAPNSTDEETIAALRDTGITVYHFPEDTDFEDVATATEVTGQLTGNCEGAAEAIAWMDANVESVENATADVDRPGLMYPLGGGYVVGGETFIHEIVVTSGAENLGAEEFNGYQQMNDERILELDPEVLLITENTGYIVDEEPYASTTAGQENATASVDVNYLNQPAPRSVVYATQNITMQLHPDAYDEGDFVSREEARDRLSTDDEDTATDDGEDDAEESDSTADDGVPGFGIAAAALAIALSALLARRDR